MGAKMIYMYIYTYMNHGLDSKLVYCTIDSYPANYNRLLVLVQTTADNKKHIAM